MPGAWSRSPPIGKLPTASKADGIGSGEYDCGAAAFSSDSTGDWSWTTYYELAALGELDDAPDVVLVFGVTRNFGRVARHEAPIN